MNRSKTCRNSNKTLPKPGGGCIHRDKQKARPVRSASAATGIETACVSSRLSGELYLGFGTEQGRTYGTTCRTDIRKRAEQKKRKPEASQNDTVETSRR